MLLLDASHLCDHQKVIGAGVWPAPINQVMVDLVVSNPIAANERTQQHVQYNQWIQ
jgi:hypothetical protein